MYNDSDTTLICISLHIGKKHSTETALLKVKCDIMDNLDQGDLWHWCWILVQLLSHEFLLKCLNDSFGIKGHVLRWFNS